MACSGAYADYNDFTLYWCNTCANDDDAGRINSFLRLAAGKIHAALQAQNQCTCTLTTWAVDYLKELNVLAAVAFYNCPCIRITDEERSAAMQYVTEQLTQLRSGQLTVCEGDTGNEYPVVGWAEIGVTDRNTATIIHNRILRRGV